jgi:molybdopterin-guanine dinucleotide biosynthesis protein
MKKSFKIISVTGAHSKVGKTTLCSILLKEFQGFGAIKFTKTSSHPSLVDDVKILKQKGKDTAIMCESGAERVLWIQSPRHRLKGLLENALDRMKDLKGVIVEGNSPVDFLNPHLVIFIIGQDGQIKSSALHLSKRADVLIINSNKQVKGLPSNISINNKKVFWIDLIKKKGEMDEFLCFVKEKITGGSNQRDS